MSNGNKMYVRWKTLIGFGLIFWIALCAYDAYFIDPVTRSHYPENDEYGWLSQVTEKEMVQESPAREDDIVFPPDNQQRTSTLGLLFWSVFTFCTTYVLCTVGSLAAPHLHTLWQIVREKQEAARRATEPEPAPRRGSSSRIPVIIQSRSCVNLPQPEEEPAEADPDGFVSNSSTSVETNVRSSKSEIAPSARAELLEADKFERMREKMMASRVESLRENAVLSRKVEQLAREKRDMYKKLMVTQRENRAAKHQLEELLDEKAVLLKRLDCAAKEFKENTKSKKSALARLEESHATIAALRQDLEKVVYEKEVVEERARRLEEENRGLRAAGDAGKGGRNEAGAAMVAAAPKKVLDYSQKIQSQKDIRRVQTRLENLELHLAKFKNNPWLKQEEEKPAKGAQDGGNGANFMEMAWDKREAPSKEEREGGGSKFSDNLTDEQRRKILEPESVVSSNRSGSYHLGDPFERVGSMLKSMKTGRASPGASIFDGGPLKERGSSKETSPGEETANDEGDTGSARFLTESAVFQEFLKTMETGERSEDVLTYSHFIS